jgi:hypothetical protein
MFKHAWAQKPEKQFLDLPDRNPTDDTPPEDVFSEAIRKKEDGGNITIKKIKKD